MQSTYRQPNLTSYVKTFNATINTNTLATWLLKSTSNVYTLTPTKTNANVQINGNLTVVGSINNPSDQRLKTDVKDIDEEDIDKLFNLVPKKYNYENDVERKEHYGLIAQDVEEQFPNLVSTDYNRDENGESVYYKTVNYIEIIPLLLKKMQNMQEQIDTLTQRLKTQEK
jgi:hypothetical protein